MSRFDLGSVQRIEIGTRFGRSFDTLSRRLLDRFVQASGAELKASPSLVT